MSVAGINAIDQHFAALKQRSNKLDLGKPLEPHQEAGNGVEFRVYEKGRIYWSAATGAHEVHGGILTHYLNLNGHKNENLGLPLFDQETNRSIITPQRPVSHFQKGAIYLIEGIGGVAIYGPFYQGRNKIEDYPIADPISVGDGLLLVFGRFVKFFSPATEGKIITIYFVWPDLGKPVIIHPERSFPLSIKVLAPAGLWEKIQQKQPGLLKNIIDKNFLLQSVDNPVQRVSLAVDTGLLVVDKIFKNLADLPPITLGLEADDIFTSIEAGDEKAREKLIQLAGTAFGNTNLIASLTNDKSFSEDSLDKAILDDGRRDIPPIQKEAMHLSKLSLKLTVGDKNAVDDATLYNLCLNVPARSPLRIAPHAYYLKESWSDFGFIHATDLHVGLRNDQFRRRLERADKIDGVEAYNNWNDAFRDLIHYANHLHDIGLLDFIMATGDIVDYFNEWPKSKTFADKSELFAYDPFPGSQNNFDLFIKLVLGQSPYPDAEKTRILHEELRVPIFTTLGNHDYRSNPYPLYHKVDLPTKEGLIGSLLGGVFGGFLGMITGFLDDDLIPSFMKDLIPDIDKVTSLERRDFKGFNITEEETKAIQGKFDLSGDDALKLLDVERTDIIKLGKTSYIVHLGPHRLVMLDTGRDAGIFDNKLDAFFAAQKFWSTEDKENLAGGAPNSMGISERELGLVRKAIDEADKDGLVIVGMHAPPLNPADDEVPHYFRETEHPTADVREILGFLIRSTTPFKRSTPSLENNILGFKSLIKDWQITKDKKLKETPYFKSGGIDTLMDWGIASRIEGKTEEFLRLCAEGINRGGTPKKVDLVLFGHVHMRIEYRLEWKDDELRFFTDFYSQNPRVYYPSHKADLEEPVHLRVTNTKITGPVESIPDDVWKSWLRVEIPKFSQPLNSSQNPKKWWNERRPILAQTAALGPMKVSRRKANNKTKPGPDFQGFRVIFVRNNVIPKMRYVSLRKLRKNDFVMPWESNFPALEEDEFEDDDQELVVN